MRCVGADDGSRIKSGNRGADFELNGSFNSLASDVSADFPTTLDAVIGSSTAHHAGIPAQQPSAADRPLG